MAWRSLQQLREDFKASGIDLGKPTVDGPGTQGCRGKVRHPSQAIADEALRDLKASTQEPHRRTVRLGVYRCRWCRFWHVGHSAGRRRDD